MRHGYDLVLPESIQAKLLLLELIAEPIVDDRHGLSSLHQRP